MPAPGPLRLDVLLLTDDERLARRVGAVCELRDHALSTVRDVREMRRALERRTPHVLLLDAAGSPAEAAALAAQIVATHASVRVALATTRNEGRSVGGFRVVNVRLPRERVADELELAYIGIPASMYA